MDTENLILQMVNIKKNFSGVDVLHDVDFDLRAGEVHAIIGQNGAGKSVLMKILDGVYKKSSGQIIIDGREVTHSSPKEARKLGIGMIFQEFSLIPALSVAKNIFLNTEIKKWFIVKDRSMIKASKDILESFGLKINPRKILSELPVSYKQIVEIAKSKQEQLSSNTLEAAVKTVIGTCVSIGLTVNEKSPKEVIAEIKEENIKK